MNTDHKYGKMLADSVWERLYNAMFTLAAQHGLKFTSELKSCHMFTFYWFLTFRQLFYTILIIANNHCNRLWFTIYASTQKKT